LERGSCFYYKEQDLENRISNVDHQKLEYRIQ
jgi:hypothetical protein